jgi:hypothetical protein
MKNYYKESRSRELSYKEYKKEKTNGRPYTE